MTVINNSVKLGKMLQATKKCHFSNKSIWYITLYYNINYKNKIEIGLELFRPKTSNMKHVFQKKKLISFTQKTFSNQGLFETNVKAVFLFVKGFHTLRNWTRAQFKWNQNIYIYIYIIISTSTNQQGKYGLNFY
jgi:hypothetical protein